MRSLKAVGLIVGVVLSVSLRADSIEFAGYARMKGELEFVLTERESGRSSGWLRLGQTFQGFTLREFDAKGETLSVSKGQESVKLPLKSAKIEDRDAALARAYGDDSMRYAAGEIDEERLLLSRIALFSFRRDWAASLEMKIHYQDMVFVAQERREALAKERRAVGVATDLDVLERTKDTLREKVALNELRQRETAATAPSK